MSAEPPLEGASYPVHPSVRVDRRPVDESESRRANGPDWDRYADEYQATHGEFLGDVGFVWGPEGLTEERRGVLGDVAGRDVLEVGSGAGQCSRWVSAQGGRPVGLDLSMRQLQHSRRIDDADRRRRPVGARHRHPPAVRGRRRSTSSSAPSARCSSSPTSTDAVAEAARVLRPGGRFAFSITHPTRWMFPDDPGEAGLVASQSYWDRTPYVEVDDETGEVAYVEHHRTLGDWVALLAGHGFVIDTLLEPEWPEGHDRVWGGWSGTRGRFTPGTAIFAARLLPSGGGAA